MIFFQPEQYQIQCNELYEQYKTKISQVLPSAQVEHIGASSIPNCVSKGDLDIYVGVTNVELVIPYIEKLGFKIKEDTMRTEQLCMLESRKEEDVAIQLIEKGSKFEDFLSFRNALL